MPHRIPVWTDEIRERTAKATIAVLIHASLHGDPEYAAKLLRVLPVDNWRASLAIWFNKQTPIHVGAAKDKIFARLRKESDPNFRRFNLRKSKAALKEFLCPGLRFTDLPKGHELSKEIKEIERHFKRQCPQVIPAPDLKKAAINALTHAKAYGDVSRMRILVESLPSSAWSGGIRAWIYTYSPIRRDRKSGRWRQARTSDSDYRPYDIEGATKAPIHGSGLPNIGSLIRDDSFSKWKQDLSNFSHEELFEAFKSHSDSIVRRNLIDDPKARRTISSIADEWLRRRHEDDYFAWPSTDAPSGLTRIGNIQAPDLGVFAALGYRVGKIHGQPVELRRFVLDHVFQSHLPPINDATYMGQWDKPLSPQRLRKMANAIATFIRNFKRMASENYELAITQWNDDLQYLYENYYVGKFHFAWVQD